MAVTVFFVNGPRHSLNSLTLQYVAVTVFLSMGPAVLMMWEAPAKAATAPTTVALDMEYRYQIRNKEKNKARLVLTGGIRDPEGVVLPSVYSRSYPPRNMQPSLGQYFCFFIILRCPVLHSSCFNRCRFTLLP